MSARLVGVLGLALLGGCASTNILSSANPSRASPSAWADAESLPVELHGSVPGVAPGELSAMFPRARPSQIASLGMPALPDAGRRIVLYLNPAQVAAPADLCSGAGAFQPGRQDGRSAYVVGALCDGRWVITRATANILTRGATPAQLRQNFDVLRVQLWQSLTPGNNNPELYKPSQMYG